MKHKLFVQLFFALLSTVIALQVFSAEPAPKYNVLLLMSDEHTTRVLGCYGNPVIKTPALDSLAAHGMRFTAAYCQDPICVPSRTSMLTGKMGSNVNSFDNTLRTLSDKETTLADVFVKSGYKASWLGKTHWAGRSGFSEGEPKGKNKEGSAGRLPQNAQAIENPVSENYETMIADAAVRHLKEDAGKPFFLGVSFVRPHFPYVVQDEYIEPYRKLMTLPTVTEKILSDLPNISKKERTKYKLETITDAQTLNARAVYYGMVTFVDEQMGRILKALDDNGLRKNTIVLYIADHGEMMGEHGLWYKNSFYDDSARVPFIWSIPGVTPEGKVCAAPVMNMDIFPTLCELCGIMPPPGLEGSSLVPLFTGRDDGKNRVALSENYRGGTSSRMIRTYQWKYNYFHEDREQLFNMQNDPDELQNLIANPEYSELVKELKAKALAGWKMYDAKVKPAESAGKGKKAGKNDDGGE